MLHVLLLIFIQFTSFLYTQMLNVQIPFDLCAGHHSIPVFSSLKNFSTFTKAQYRHTTMKHCCKQNWGRLSQAATKYKLCAGKTEFPKIQWEANLSGRCWRFSASEIHLGVYGNNIPVTNYSGIFKWLICPSSHYLNLWSVRQMCKFEQLILKTINPLWSFSYIFFKFYRCLSAKFH